MKAVLTLVFIIVTGVTALANTGKHVKDINPQIKSYVQITSLKMGTLLDSGILIDTNDIEVEIKNTTSVARLYKFKNSRIKKALSFTTKRNKAKMV
jgi:hypothetical protein